MKILKADLLGMQGNAHLSQGSPHNNQSFLNMGLSFSEP